MRVRKCERMCGSGQGKMKNEEVRMKNGTAAFFILTSYFRIL
jgi:hypothetical protein